MQHYYNIIIILMQYLIMVFFGEHWIITLEHTAASI